MEEMSTVDQYTPLRRGFILNDNIPKRFSFSTDEKSDDTICVYVRIKPDETPGTKDFLSYSEDENTIKLKKKAVEQEFKFTKIFPPQTSQVDIFEKCAKPSLKKMLSGQNAFIFTYGASNSGKTYTVQGAKAEPGILPRSLATVFSSLQNYLDPTSIMCPEQGVSVVALNDSELNEKLSYKKKILALAKNMLPQMTKSDSFIAFNEYEQLEVEPLNINEQRGVYSIWLTFYEIYNEKVFDVFEDLKETKKPLRLMTDKDSTVYVKGLKHIPVNNLYEAFLLYSFGRFNLNVNSTAVNDRSSRSHAVFSIKVVGRPESNTSSYFLSSSYSVCDLAGTERAHKTKNEGMRLREAQQINASILFFNKCLRIIRENQNSEIKKHVPYRESKLTQILGRSLTCGDSCLVMIVTVSQNEHYQEEIEGTLKSSSVALSIKALSPPQIKSVKKMRFSMAISNCRRGRGGVDWKAVAASKKHLEENKNEAQGAKTGCKNCEKFRTVYQPGFAPDVYKELEEERNKRLAAEEKLQELTKIHREEIARLQEKLNNSPAEKNIRTLKKMLEESEEEFMACRVEVLKLKKDMRLLKEEIEEKNNLIKQLETTNESYKEMLDDAKEEVEFLQEDVDEICRSRDQIIAVKDEKIESLETEKMDLEEQLKAYAEVEEELSNKIQELADIQNEFKALSKELYDSKMSNTEMQKENKRYLQQLQNAWEENDAYRRHIDTLESQMKSFEENKQEIIRRYESLLEEKQKILEANEIKNENQDIPEEKKENVPEAKGKKTNYTLRAQRVPKINLEPNSDDESIFEPATTNEKPLRTRSQERRNVFSDYNDSIEDPSFILAHNQKSRTTGKKKRPKTKKHLNSNIIPDYGDVGCSYSSNGMTEATSGRSRRKLFLRSSSDFGNNEESIRINETNQTEASPATILKRVLRTGKKY